MDEPQTYEAIRRRATRRALHMVNRALFVVHLLVYLSAASVWQTGPVMKPIVILLLWGVFLIAHAASVFWPMLVDHYTRQEIARMAPGVPVKHKRAEQGAADESFGGYDVQESLGRLIEGEGEDDLPDAFEPVEKHKRT